MAKKNNKVGDVISSLKLVYIKIPYFILTFTVFISLIIFNIGIINYKFYIAAPNFKVALAVFFGTFETLFLHSVILMFIASLLTGILLSLIVFHLKNQKGKNNSVGTGSFGAFLGILAPACASCGIGLIAALGLTGLLATLPFSGLEVSILGIILLIYAIVALLLKISSKTCNTNEIYLRRMIRKWKR